jgi:ribokinase
MNSCQCNCPETVEVVGLGLCAWDRICLFDRYPGPNQKVEVLRSAESGGGPVPTALAVFSRLGGKASFVGVIGDRQDGLKIRSDLISYGVDVSELIMRPDRRSPCATIWVDGGSGLRTVALDPGNAESISINELPADLLQKAPILLIDGRDAAVCIEAAKLCKEGGGKVILDAGSPRASIEDLLAVTDHAVVSHDFLKGIFPDLDEVEALRRMQAMGPSSVVVTLGEEGGLWRDGDSNGRYDAFSVDAVDTTGAGDAFHGGYLFGLKSGLDMAERCRFAAAVAALVCRGLGGRKTTPAYEEVMKFIGE